MPNSSATGEYPRAERRSTEGPPDVRADLRSGDTVIFECKWEESRSLLETQLDDRLPDFPDALGLLGVLYPARLRQEEDTRACRLLPTRRRELVSATS